jgi:hypothetical protein
MKRKRVVLKRTKSGAKNLKIFPKGKFLVFGKMNLIGFRA